jgi:hypothetical protein
MDKLRVFQQPHYILIDTLRLYSNSIVCNTLKVQKQDIFVEIFGFRHLESTKRSHNLFCNLNVLIGNLKRQKNEDDQRTLEPPSN